MNYKKNYEDYINYVKTLIRKRSKTIYYEKHHIIPKSLGGSNRKENLVLLTAREHFLAHYLLCKIYENTSNYYKMLCAFQRMTFNTEKTKGLLYMNSILFEKMKKERSKKVSEFMKGNTWGFNKDSWKHVSVEAHKRAGLKNLGKKLTEEQRKKISEKTKEAMKRSEVKERLGSGHRGKPAWNKGIKKEIKEFWWTNGVIQTKSETCPEGFYRGRLPNKKQRQYKCIEINKVFYLKDAIEFCGSSKIGFSANHSTRAGGYHWERIG